MRILFAADVLPDPNSGAAGTEYQTIQALRKLGHDVDEIWAADLPHKIKHGNLHYLLELPKGYRDVINRRWEKVNYDVIHANQGHAYLAAKEHLRRRRPGIFVCRSHGLDDHMEKVLKSWRKKLGIRNRGFMKSVPGKIVDVLLDRHIKLSAQYVSGFIVSSSLDRQFLLEYHNMPPERVACIHQAPSELFIRSPAVGLNEQRLKKILYIGGVSYWKGPHTVASAANGFLMRNRNLRLTWVCSERDHQTAKQMLHPDAVARTDIIGWTSQDKLCTLYDEHGIFIYPSLFDGFGKVFLEAMSRGLCVITTRTGGMRDIIQSGLNGFLVDFNDASAIINKIGFLHAHHAEACEISKAARTTAMQYTWERVARETVEFYRSVMELPVRRVN